MKTKILFGLLTISLSPAVSSAMYTAITKCEIVNQRGLSIETKNLESAIRSGVGSIGIVFRVPVDADGNKADLNELLDQGDDLAANRATAQAIEGGKDVVLVDGSKAFSMVLKPLSGRNEASQSQMNGCSLEDSRKDRFLYRLSVVDAKTKQASFEKTIEIACSREGFSPNASMDCDGQE